MARNVTRTKTQIDKELGPTVGEWLSCIGLLTTLLRKAIDKPGSVKRGELREVLEDYERLDKLARGAARRPL